MLIQNNACRICRSRDVCSFLFLGDQPLANSFLKKDSLLKPEPKYPLDVCFCGECNLVQLRHVVDKEMLFSDYIYFSSGMPKLSNHFKTYAEDIISRFLEKNDFVVELASNDGILLKFFQDNGYRVLGVDPAKNIASIAASRGIPTIVDFWSAKLAKKILDDYGKARVILANNVVAHINNHHDLVNGIATLLADNGVFVLEAPYLVDMFENLTYDTIYHEHLSYLAVRPLKRLFEQFGLEIFNVEIHSVQGQSLRVFVGKKGKRAIKDSVAHYCKLEFKIGLDKQEAYEQLAERIELSKQKLITLLKNLKRNGNTIAAYGAPAKGNTLLNYCGIGADILDYALEDLPSKQGLFTPGMHIPVVDRADAEANLPDYYLLLAWNYLNPILIKERLFRERGGKFIIPVGDEIKII